MNPLALLGPDETGSRLVLSVLIQVTVVILAAATLARALLGRHAAARHGLWLGVLLWVLISPAVAAVLDRSGLMLLTVRIPTRGTATETLMDPIAGGRPGEGPRDADLVAETAPTAPAALGSTTPRIASVSPVSRDMTVTDRPTPRGGVPRTTIAGGLTAIWALGVLIAIARIASGWGRVAASMRDARPLGLQRHGDILASVRDALGGAPLPPVVTSSTATGPFAAGLLRPRVVLPARVLEALSTRELRDVLVHECAHIARGDPWIGLLQRLASALFWPHPMVHYLNAQLARAREEVCDNFVLRCGDPCSYSRTLLALTKLCSGPAWRAGYGILTARWTLAARVAGLLDNERVIMTRTTLRTRVALAFALLATGLPMASVQIHRPSMAAESGGEPGPTPAATAAPRDAVWRIEGAARDDQGRPVAGAVIRVVVSGADADETTTAADGRFAVPLAGSARSLYGVAAEADGGRRIGLARFESGVPVSLSETVRIVLKPSRTVTVRVKDAAGAPVAGATVEAIDYSFQTHATTGPDGSATLRVADGARVEWVIGYKSGAGFDYFENYQKRRAVEFPPLPDELTLTLGGAKTVRVRAIDTQGRPAPGVVVIPRLVGARSKISPADVAYARTPRVTTDGQGVAAFDWLPRDGVGASFQIRAGAFSDSNSRLTWLLSAENGPDELTARVLRATRLSGAVRFRDGRPARGMLVQAQGDGAAPDHCFVSQRTGDDGTYAIDVPPDRLYAVAVIDEEWSAPTRMGLVVREGQAQDGLDFTLEKGTLLHGRITEESGLRPSERAVIQLSEPGPVLPKDLRGTTPASNSLRKLALFRSTTTDTEGRFHFRVGPGLYTLMGPPIGGARPLAIEVKDEPEIIHDLDLKSPAHVTTFDVVVVEKTPTGDHPVPRAIVGNLRSGIESPISDEADDRGRLRLVRYPNTETVYARSVDGTLAGFTPVPEGTDSLRAVVAPATQVSGRVVDAGGKLLANAQVEMRLDSGPRTDYARPSGAIVRMRTDEQGRFSFPGVPPGTRGELSVHHSEPLSPGRARTVITFQVPDTEPVQAPDLVIPATVAADQSQ
jgi:beta-lactamase regulating signal transducer with metallopeptidase domain